jgi:hypothetical protein
VEDLSIKGIHSLYVTAGRNKGEKSEDIDWQGGSENSDQHRYQMRLRPSTGV